MLKRAVFATGVAIVTTMMAGLNATAAPLVQPPPVLNSSLGAYKDTSTLSFAMWSFSDLRSGTVTLNLAVRSRTDMPVPNVFVYVSHCTEGQLYPFLLAAKVRHMDGKHEILNAYAGGRFWQWRPFSAPANISPWLVLRLTFKVLQEGGPVYCIQGEAGTTYDHGHNAVIERRWTS